MNDSPENESKEQTAPIAFKAETRQLLNILIHSLYKERDIFLRELISNASDALTRINFEMLTNREINDPDAELAIRIIPDKNGKTLTIEDSGIGMTSDELITNLGTIAQSGVRDFVATSQDTSADLSELIGQFGVGFYSAFMVADWIKVVSRSYQKDSTPASWYCTGSDTFSVEPGQKEERGTSVTVKLKEDAAEFCEEGRLREIIRKHSDFIPFPIYIGDEKEQVNRQTAIWREQPREVEESEYEEFYKQLTLDFEPPLTYAHMTVDAPAQMYAILYIPATAERTLFSPRKEEGLKLYARKVLIQEYNRDLLPEYLGFVQGVVDSEDLPLNVSRDTVQSTRVIAQLKKLVTAKVIDSLKKLAKDEKEKYEQFWEGQRRFIKHGIAVEQAEPDMLYPLLRFHTTTHPDEWISLEQYTQRMVEGQSDIYYILGDDDQSVLHSPHLDIVHHLDYEVLLLTETADAFMLVNFSKYKELNLANVAKAELTLPEGEKPKENDPATEEEYETLLVRFKDHLGDQVADVRTTERLIGSPARLVDEEGAPNQEIQRVYRLLNREFDVPKKILEINPRHTILTRLNSLSPDDPLSELVIDQIYEDALLIEGQHPDPASMISRIQKLIEAALNE